MPPRYFVADTTGETSEFAIPVPNVSPFHIEGAEGAAADDSDAPAPLWARVRGGRVRTCGRELVRFALRRDISSSARYRRDAPW